jgi:hypothetical protein
MLFISVVAAVAAPGKADFEKWSKSAKVPGYSFGGVEQTDPGVYMAVWMNAKTEMIAVRLEPAANFKSYLQIVNKKKPLSFTYKGLQSLYIDALSPSASVVVKYEKSGALLNITNQNQPKALTKEELTRLLDGMRPEAFLN